MSSPGTSPQMQDADVRREALEPRESFIVQAPAGSGKTELLMQRYLSVLAASNVEEPESVLAITFTRKAAAEMRNRILAALERAATLDEHEAERLPQHERTAFRLARAVLARDRERDWHLLENPSRLMVRTIDSFCDGLARRVPLNSALSPDAQVTDQAEALYQEAARRTIAELSSAGPRGDAVERLLTEQDNNVPVVRQLIVNMLSRRDQWLRFVGRADQASATQSSELRARFEQCLRNTVVEEMREIRQTLNRELDDPVRSRIFTFLSIAASNLGSDDVLALINGLENWPAAEPEERPRWLALVNWLLTKDKNDCKFRVGHNKNTGFPAGSKSDKDACNDFFRELNGRAWSGEVCTALARVRELPPTNYSEEQWAFVQAMFTLLPYAVAHLRVIFAEQGVTDFAEVALAAQSALKEEDNPTDLGLALGCRIRHILVDEFQDTSRSQMLLLQSLVETWEFEDDATLFVVGDPMQSIYGFRQADVLNFLRARNEGVGPWPLQSRELTTNFRSQARMVEWFNQVFEHILTEDNAINAAVKYSPAAAIRPPLAGDAVQAFGFDPGDYAAEAAKLAAMVCSELDADVNASIAILVRARTHLPRIIEALRREQIAFRAVKIDELSSRQTVRDLDALKRALLHPADRIAWLAVLRAPYSGLSLDDLWQLCREDQSNGAMLDLMRSRVENLSVAGQARVRRLVDTFEQARSRYGRVALAEWVESTWVQLGGVAGLPDGEKGESALRDAKAYLSLLRDCESSGAEIEGAEFSRRLEKLFAPADTAPDVRVEIMTIHNAKGLEWDVVLLPGLGRKGQDDGKQLLYWREHVVNHQSELLLAPADPAGKKPKEGTVASYLRGLSNECSREEQKRLLYVAATRARKRLYLFSCLPEDGKAPMKGTMLELLYRVPGMKEKFLRQAFLAQAVSAESENTAWRRLPADWKLPEPPARLQWKKPHRSAEEAHTFEWVGDLLPKIGTVTHAILQQITREGLEHWTPERMTERQAIVEATLLRAGVAQRELHTAVETVRRAVAQTLADERGRWILSPHAEQQSECALSTLMEGEMRSIRIDSTFVEDGVRWIIDFKTSDMQGSNMDRFLAAQVEKYRDDLRRYAAIMRLRETRPIRCALYFPLLQQWVPVEIEN